MGIKILAFFVTERCNLSCNYCDIPHIKHPKDYDVITFLRYIDIINQYPLECVTLTGGEPGLLPEYKLELLFNNIKHSINVNTNGEFIKRGFYDKWKHKIAMIDYHITQNVDYEIDTSKRVDCDFPKGRYVIVSHKENHEFIDSIQKKYPEINFRVTPYDDKLNEPKFRDDHQNEKDNHVKCNPIKEIDWVNDRLVDCCLSPISSPTDELTESNLKAFLEIYYTRRWHACKTCQRGL